MNHTALETVGLTRSFGGLIAVNNIHLNVEAGSVFGFLGPNGAGKTTTIRIVLGLIKPDRGRVMLFGQDLSSHRLSILGRVGALVETPSLYNHLTGFENLEVTRRLLGCPKENIENALEIVKLTEAAHRLVREYSLGMRQRLGLALALLNRPEILILDEPTNGLDPAGIREMRALIKQLPAQFGITVFLSSHLLSEVEQLASHVGIIHQGTLLFQGSLNELHAHQHERLVLEVDRPAVAMELLTQQGWHVQREENNRLTVSSQGRKDAAFINSLLVREGLKVFHLSRQQPSLEETFFQLTGEPTAGDPT
ncbi:MAG: ATP-binding cassette domain-containing protein [Ignavibacteriales bacterium]|nr:ATP-binding cassette domain-containing protein [Ignavibacteriales bacterium]